MDPQQQNPPLLNQGQDPPQANLADQLVLVLQNLQIQQPAHHHNQQQQMIISIKLNQFNYSLWLRLMRMTVGGRCRLHHLTGQPAPPVSGDQGFPAWEQADLNCCTWLLDNMDSDMVPNYAEYPTAKAIWDALNETYGQKT